MNTETDAAMLFLTGQLPFILITSAILAFPISFILLLIYKRAVLKSMRSHSGSELLEEKIQKLTNSALVKNFITDIEAKQLYEKAFKLQSINSMIYLIAGFGYAFVMSFAFLIATKSEFLLIKILFMIMIYSWPSVFLQILLILADKKSKLITASIYFLIFLSLSLLAIFKSTELTFSQTIFLLLWFNLPASILILAFLYRKIRAVGPLVITLMIFAVAGSLLVLTLVGGDENILRAVSNIGFSIGLNTISIFVALLVLGFFILGLVGWKILRWIGKSYKEKKISDQTVMADSFILIFGIVQSVTLSFEGSLWILSGIVSFLVFKTLTIIGFKYKKIDNNKFVPKLLLLRVFSLGKRSEKLFDKLAKYWRNVGSIQLISGPDLATTTIEPHEFLDFIGGRLSRQFIGSSEVLEEHISNMDVKADSDLRYRVNEYFCYEDTWKVVLSRLANETDVVLMDLRGFNNDNDGCKFEIYEILNLQPANCIVFITDSTTNEDYLNDIMLDAWNSINADSPNITLSFDQLQIYKLNTTSSLEFNSLLKLIFKSIESQDKKLAQNKS